jgi:hypothetical protein
VPAGGQPRATSPVAAQAVGANAKTSPAERSAVAGRKAPWRGGWGVIASMT